jgi:hypothetical protein
VKEQQDGPTPPRVVPPHERDVILL